MTRTYCDRCGNEIRKPFKKCLMFSKLYYKRVFTFGPTKEELIYHEICKDCQESLEHWWTNPKKEGTE